MTILKEIAEFQFLYVIFSFLSFFLKWWSFLAKTFAISSLEWSFFLWDRTPKWRSVWKC